MIPVPQHILDEIKKHDLESFKKLGLDHGGVTNAVAFFLNNGMEDMAKTLRQMAQDGLIRQGPLDGFVAAAVTVDPGEFIFLSTAYPEYLSSAELMASLVQEVGFLSVFNRATEENELRAQAALQWISKQKPAVEPASFIASAALKRERQAKQKHAG